MARGNRTWLWAGGAVVLVGLGGLITGGVVFSRTDQGCMMISCMAPIQACQANQECSDWLECMEGCGDDQMLCPTVCGAFYQAPEINDLITCALESECLEIDFSALPDCDPPHAERVPLGDFDGFWWVSAIHGHDYVLYDDCQRFVFSTQDDTHVSAHNSTLVSYEGETRVVDNIGQFTRTSDGSLDLVYENWVGYREQYNPMFATERVMLMHVCSEDTTGAVHDYGALVLTRTPLEDLDATERDALEAAVQEIYGLPLADFRSIGTQGCANGPSSSSPGSAPAPE